MAANCKVIAATLALMLLMAPIDAVSRSLLEHDRTAPVWLWLVYLIMKSIANTIGACSGLVFAFGVSDLLRGRSTTIDILRYAGERLSSES